MLGRCRAAFAGHYRVESLSEAEDYGVVVCDLYVGELPRRFPFVAPLVSRERLSRVEIRSIWLGIRRLWVNARQFGLPRLLGLDIWLMDRRSI